jgi:hypothetical protein
MTDSIQNADRGELSAAESARLAECETTITAGLQTFYEVGGALLVIRDARLYRRDFPTFEAYCRGRWHMGASRARQLIGAAGVASNLEGVTFVTLTNEAQARELAALAADEQQTVWAFAVASAPVVDDGPHVTAAHIKKAAYTVELLRAYGWRGDVTPGRAYLIDEEFHAQMPPVEPELFDLMEESMLRLGVINPLDMWGNTVVDGHVRYFIAMRNGLPFEVTLRTFEGRDDAIRFILETHVHRKNYTAAELTVAYEKTGDESLLIFIRLAERREASEGAAA